MKKIVFFMALLIPAGCQTVAEQALNNGGAVSQPVQGRLVVVKKGIYRLQKDRNGKIKAKFFCSSTLKNPGFGKVGIASTKSSDTITDEKPADSFVLSFNPITKEKKFENLKIRAGVKFKGIPTSRRVVEKYSVSGYNPSVDETGETFDGDYVMRSVGPVCKKGINSLSSYKKYGLPIFVYEVATADKIYSKITGLPELSVALLNGSGKKKYGDFVLAADGGITYDRARNKVFGYSYFPIGEHASKPIPVTR
ncbi:hypothetical protein [Lentilitoribacter sp. EG35]|uniref:hypothetical protein n=1 Tax=Lentilitoribacter sp. EG35 TaxID=3234192 RepID=UPI003460F16A